MTFARWVMAALLAATPCAFAQTPAPIVPESEMLASLGREFAPAYAALDRSAGELHASVVALCGERSSGTALHSAQAAWRATGRQWRFVAAWPVGPLLERRSLRRFDFWPTRTPQIEAAVAQQASGALSVDKVGFSAQGLPALEYLLFGERAPASRSTEHCAFAQTLAASYAAEAAALAAGWTQWSARWSQPDAQVGAVAALGETLNVLAGTLERLRVRMLAKPAAAPAGGSPAWDAWRSGATREHLLATLEGAQRALAGGDSQRGLLALLRGRGQLALAARLEDRMQRAAAALRGLPPDLRRARTAAVAPAHTALSRLQATLSNEVADVLRVTMGFNETDGD